MWNDPKKYFAGRHWLNGKLFSRIQQIKTVKRECFSSDIYSIEIEFIDARSHPDGGIGIAPSTGQGIRP